MRVSKMHGTRNDFVLVDARTAPVADASSLARSMCDRRAGVGADGLILLEVPFVGDVRMRIVNADGSEAEMCGNGIRCAARWLDEAGAGERIAFETEAGIVRTDIVTREPEYLVRVAMGRPAIEPGPNALAVSTFVDLGNPHVVVFEAGAGFDALDLPAMAFEFQKLAAFPNGTNVHLAATRGTRSIRARHWERGVGLTQACGTGAVACAAVAIEKGLATSPVEVFVPGGRLVVEWDGEGEAYLTGPATRVFDTEVNASVLSAH
jgi:diaminopimelate epimerase